MFLLLLFFCCSCDGLVAVFCCSCDGLVVVVVVVVVALRFICRC